MNIKGLSVSYGAHNALNSMDLVIHAGEIMGLIGPNGAGKSSLIKALCGRVKTDSGLIMVHGKTLKHGEARHDLIGLVPQDIALYGHMTARENLGVFAKLAGAESDHLAQTVEDALKSVNMQDKAEWRVDKLSGGMKRRINLAAAIMHAPKLLIFDEPMAGVDVAARETLMGLMRELAGQGMGILLVSHELDQMQQMCDRVCILANGKKLICDGPDKVLKDIYGSTRQTAIKLDKTPTEKMIKKLGSLGFEMGETSTQWNSFKTVSNLEDLYELGATDVGVKQPNLSTLMHYIERTGDLP